jgi:hypothetical protein
VATFREAVEAGDFEAIGSMLADNVVFTSPVAFKPYAGKAITAAILRAVSEVFVGFRYVQELEGTGGRDHALIFEATVDGLAIAGCDFIHYNDAGKIDTFTVMVRPLRAAEALAARMGERFEQIQAQALAAADVDS